jgi:DNA-binding Lrp family transcriptional regulator
MKRKKKIIDGMDKQILREINSARRSLTSRQIGQKVNLSGSAIIPRLNNLKFQGILKAKPTGLRSFNRMFGKNQKLVKVKAPRSIYWNINLIKPEERKKRK